MAIPEVEIRDQLNRKLQRDDDDGIQDRKGRLVRLFQGLDRVEATALLSRLGNGDDELGELFKRRLASATRIRLTSILMDIIGGSQRAVPQVAAQATSGLIEAPTPAPSGALPPPVGADQALEIAGAALTRARASGRTEHGGMGLDMLECVISTARRTDFDDEVIFAETLTPHLSELERGDVGPGQLVRSFRAQWKTLRPSDSDELVLGKLLFLVDSLCQVRDYVTRHLEHSGIAASPSVAAFNEWLRDRSGRATSLYHCIIGT